MQRSLSKQNFFGLLLLTTVLFGNVSTFAQTRRRAATAKKPATSAAQTKETKLVGEN